ncbi:MAG: hypothetical protein ACRDIA_00855, partial [Actinomycetota bacterium]
RIAYALETGKLGASLVSDALKNGKSSDLAVYREALHDIYAAYYRIGRLFVKLISQPALFKAMCQIGLRSHTVMSFVFQIMGNLVEESGGTMADRAFRRALKWAEYELPELSEPDIPAPTPVAVRSNGASPNGSGPQAPGATPVTTGEGAGPV